MLRTGTGHSPQRILLAATAALLVALLFGGYALPGQSPAAGHAASLRHLEYRFIGPANMGGRVTDVEGVPGNPGIVYVGTAAAGLLKSTNGGVTWEILFEREGTVSVGDLALDPRNPEVLWVGTGEANLRNSVSFGDGVYQSVDGGKTWKHLGLSETEHIARVVVDPLDPNTVYVCAVGHMSGPNEERGVFQTTNGGASWTKILYLDDKHGCGDFEIDPQNPNILYAAMWRFERQPWNHISGSTESGLYRSADRGRTWTRVKGLPALVGRLGVKVAPSNPQVVYVAAESREGTFYRSDDRGIHFRETTRSRSVVMRGFYYSDLRVDPENENRVYALAVSLSVSDDGGKTWKTISNETHSDYHALWIDPRNPRRMWQGQDGGLAVSYDRGDTWEVVNNVPLAQFYQISASDGDPFYAISGGLQDNGSWTGPNRTRDDAIFDRDFRKVGGGDGFWVVQHPTEPDLFLFESQRGFAVRKRLGSGLSQSVTPQMERDFHPYMKYRFNWNAPIVASPHEANTVYLGSNVLFQSRDFGKTWEPISQDLTTNNRARQVEAGGPVWKDNSGAENYTTILNVQESPRRKGLLWVGTDDGLVQVTRDGGRTWTNVTPNIPGAPKEAFVSHVEASRHSEDVAYATFDAHLLDDFEPYAYKTADGGKTWVRLPNTGLPAKAYAHVLREDPKNPELLYLGTELGLYASWNGGRNWEFLGLKNLSKVPVHEVLVHPKTNDLILGTHGRGIAILDDATPVQQAGRISTSSLHLFPPTSGVVLARSDEGGSVGNKVYRGPNPPSGALFTYSLREALPKELPCKAEILDPAGKVLREIVDLPREAGAHRAAWDLRLHGEISRKGKPGEELRDAGPYAVPGEYRLRLTAGADVREERVRVSLDPALEISATDFAEATALALRLRDSLSAANGALRSLDQWKAQLQNLEKLAPSVAKDRAAAGKVLREAIAAVDEQVNSLSWPDNGYRLEDRPGLVQKLSQAYSTLSFTLAPPLAHQVQYATALEEAGRAAVDGVRRFLAEAGPLWNAELKRLGLGELPVLP